MKHAGKYDLLSLDYSAKVSGDGVGVGGGGSYCRCWREGEGMGN